MSPALSVAFFIAVRRAPCSAAAVSTSARYTWFYVHRQQRLEDRRGGGFEDVKGGMLDGSHLPTFDRQDAEGRGRRGHRALELREHHLDRVERARLELRHQRRDQLGRVAGGRLVPDVGALRCDGALGELEVADPLLADEMQVDAGPLPLELLHAAPRLANQVGVEGTAQAPVRRDEHEADAPYRTP